jgi:IclR family transcriptional regulator, KDG regulon repressor
MTRATQDTSHVKSLVRAMRIIETLSGHPSGATVTDLAAELSLPKSGVFRVLHTFEELGYVRQNPATSTYHLGSQLLRLAAAAESGSSLRTVAHPILLDLGALTAETVHLAVPIDDQMVYIDKVDSPRTVVMRSRVGQRLPLHSSSLGKAYLSALGVDDRTALIGRLSLDRRTPKTITSRRALHEAVEACAARGYALDDIENEDGVRCVGAPIVDSHRTPVAAISVSAPAGRWPRSEAHKAGKACAEAAERISRELGAP